MLAVKGIYDGSTVQLLEQIDLKKTYYVAVTFLEPFHRKDLDERKRKLLSLCGSWKDNRSPEEIIRDIHKSRKDSDRLENGL
ncbi:MAG: hypothetical protein AB1414_14525 [bacterium]